MNTTLITCPKCHEEIGHAFDVEGMAMLKVGKLLLVDSTALCFVCGTAFHWKISEKALLHFVSRSIGSIAASPPSL
jgi:hypothetical protein